MCGAWSTAVCACHSPLVYHGSVVACIARWCLVVAGDCRVVRVWCEYADHCNINPSNKLRWLYHYCLLAGHRRAASAGRMVGSPIARGVTRHKRTASHYALRLMRALGPEDSAEARTECNRRRRERRKRAKPYYFASSKNTSACQSATASADHANQHPHRSLQSWSCRPRMWDRSDSRLWWICQQHSRNYLTCNFHSSGAMSGEPRVAQGVGGPGAHWRTTTTAPPTPATAGAAPCASTGGWLGPTRIPAGCLGPASAAAPTSTSVPATAVWSELGAHIIRSAQFSRPGGATAAV